jgi:hypothetical protein
MQQLHPTMQTKNMYGNVNKDVDDKFPLQKIPFIFQSLCSKWDVTNQHVKVQFDATWIATTIKNVGDTFHKDRK